MKKDIINLTEILSLITEEIIKSTDEFKGYDCNQILISAASNRAGSRGVTYGKLQPLKFENGNSLIKHKGRLYAMSKLIYNNHEIKYIIYYYFPKFFDLPAKEKINVMFHELYHISPDFNGDIRRMGKFKKAHGHSKKFFEDQYIYMADSFYQKFQSSIYNNFLEMTSEDLLKVYKKVTYTKIRTIKPILVK